MFIFLFENYIASSKKSEYERDRKMVFEYAEFLANRKKVVSSILFFS